MNRQVVLAGLVMMLVGGWVGNSARGEIWSQFRGNTGSGVSPEKNLPVKWSGSDAQWVVNLPGRGNSSPAVTARRVDLTTVTEDQSLWVLSYDRATGKLLRQVKVGKGKLAAKGPANLYAHRHNGATPSPIADDNHVWAFFGTGLLVCVDAKSGELAWQRDLVRDYGKYDITFGMGSSPRLHGNLLYVACMTKGASYVVAFDKSTGKEVWKVDRKLPAKDDGPDSYSTPAIYSAKTGAQLLVSGSDHVTAYATDSGKELWRSAGLDIRSPYGRVIASPVAADGIVVATSANPAGAGLGHVLGIRGDLNGVITDSGRLWKHPKSTPDSSTPVVYDGLVYMVTDKGVASCLDLRDGKVVWQKRLATGTYHAAVVAGDDKVYFQNIEGQCTVLAAGSEARVLATNALEGTFYATPAISDGRMYFRAYEKLYAVGK